MRYPKSLPAGGTIGFPAPSFGCATEPYQTAFQCAMARFEKMGYRMLPGPNSGADQGIGISNSPEKCAAEIMDFFASGADCLISCGGGEMMCEILPYVDFRKLAETEPKWFMGYSDNTNLTYTLATLADMASVYGPCVSSFGMEPPHVSLKDAFGILTGEVHEVKSYGLWEKEDLKSPENPCAPYNLTEKLEIKSFVGKEKQDAQTALSFSGRLLGGCMDCLVNLLGTPFDGTKRFLEAYREDGILWFLESCDLNVFAIRRAMWELKQAGWFETAKGFLIGRPANGEPMMNLDAYRAVLDIIGELKVPVIMDVDLGHRPPMMPLVVGSFAKVQTVGNDLKIRMEYR